MKSKMLKHMIIILMESVLVFLLAIAIIFILIGLFIQSISFYNGLPAYLTHFNGWSYIKTLIVSSFGFIVSFGLICIWVDEAEIRVSKEKS